MQKTGTLFIFEMVVNHIDKNALREKGMEKLNNAF